MSYIYLHFLYSSIPLKKNSLGPRCRIISHVWPAVKKGRRPLVQTKLVYIIELVICYYTVKYVFLPHLDELKMYIFHSCLFLCFIINLYRSSKLNRFISSLSGIYCYCRIYYVLYYDPVIRTLKIIFKCLQICLHFYILKRRHI